VPWLERGYDVDGVDISQDMLDMCRERTAREHLPQPALYAQPLHELDLPRYRTIVVCGGFGLGGDRRRDEEALERLRAHLEPGGTLLLDNEVPYAYASWRYWTAGGRADLPRPWPEPGERRTGADGAEYELRHRLVDVDRLEQRITNELRALMWRDSERVADETHRLTLTAYFTYEIALMLERAGFERTRFAARTATSRRRGTTSSSSSSRGCDSRRRRSRRSRPEDDKAVISPPGNAENREKRETSSRVAPNRAAIGKPTSSRRQ
jgi:SAM-dependent methyltransferase